MRCARIKSLESLKNSPCDKVTFNRTTISLFHKDSIGVLLNLRYFDSHFGVSEIVKFKNESGFDYSSYSRINDSRVFWNLCPSWIEEEYES